MIFCKRNRTRAHNIIGPSAISLIRERLLRRAANPGGQRASLSTRMGNLNSRLGILAMNVVYNPAQRINLRILPEPRILGGNATSGLSGSRFNHDDSGAIESKLSEMDEMIVGQVAIVSAVLAHRRDDEAIVQFEGAHAQWFVESWRRGRVSGGASSRFLSWRVKGNAGLALVAKVETAHFEGL